MEEKKERTVVLPFSDEFKKWWDLWKQYKQEQFNFKYKSVISEQSILKHLVELSNGSEKMAIAIIDRSIFNGWKGFWPFKEDSVNVSRNGKPAEENGARVVSLKDLVAQRYGATK